MADRRRAPQVGFALAVSLVLIALISATTGAPVRGDPYLASVAGSVDSGSHTATSNEPVVDLLGETYVSSSLVYNGFEDGGNNTFPVLLTGLETTKFWSSSQSVLELAPSGTKGHTAGLVMFPALGSLDDTLSIVGAASSTYTAGDGLEAYLFMTPVHAANWSFPYYATNPEGANGTFASPQGAVIFPYSLTPYVLVQWDPGLGALHTVNLYLVTPGAGGVVTPSTVAVYQIGQDAGSTPGSMDHMGFNVAYNASSNTLSGIVADATASAIVLTFDEALSPLGFTPSVSAGTQYYFGAGGSGNGANSWGLLYLNFTFPEPTPAVHCPSSASSPGPEEMQPVVDLLKTDIVSSSLVYNGFANGGTCVFPTLLTGANTTKFWPVGQSVLELAPALTTVHSAGLVMFEASSFSNQTLSLVGAASTSYNSGDGLEAYLFLSPSHAVNWSTPYYATNPEGANGTFWSPQGAVIFPYSSTPYIVVQWDPGLGALNVVNLYLVNPGYGGIVTPASITTERAGSGVVTNPTVTSFIALNVTYDLSTNSLWGTVAEENTGLAVVTFNASLTKLGFMPSYSAGSPYYFGAGGSGNGENSWGLLFLSLSQVTSVSSATPYLVWELITIGIAGMIVAAVVIFVLIRKGKKLPVPPLTGGDFH